MSIKLIEANEETSRKQIEASEKIAHALEVMNSLIGTQTQRLVLQFAIQNADKNSFPYYKQNQNYGYPSKDVVRDILFAFMGGHGYRLEKFVLQSDIYSDHPEAETRYQEALKNQIFHLTGVKPLIECEKEETGWADFIYYS